MEEIPELGINAKGSYAIQEGSSISETYHEAAGLSISCASIHTHRFLNCAYIVRLALAFEELLQDDPTGAIRDGSYQFKKRFSALSRAGKRQHCHNVVHCTLLTQHFTSHTTQEIA